MNSANKQGIANEDKHNIDEPIIVMKPSKGIHFVALFFICVVTAYLILFAVIPVLVTLDYSSVWPESDKRIGRKIFTFYLGIASFLYIPFHAPFFRKGTTCFYKDKAEVKSFITNKIKTYYYSEIKVTKYGNRRLAINKKIVNGSVFHSCKTKYIDGVTFGIGKGAVDNHECIDDVLRLLENNAAEYINKPI